MAGTCPVVIFLTVLCAYGASCHRVGQEMDEGVVLDIEYNKILVEQVDTLKQELADLKGGATESGASNHQQNDTEENDLEENDVDEDAIDKKANAQGSAEGGEFGAVRNSSADRIDINVATNALDTLETKVHSEAVQITSLTPGCCLCQTSRVVFSKWQDGMMRKIGSDSRNPDGVQVSERQFHIPIEQVTKDKFKTAWGVMLLPKACTNVCRYEINGQGAKKRDQRRGAHNHN